MQYLNYCSINNCQESLKKNLHTIFTLKLHLEFLWDKILQEGKQVSQKEQKVIIDHSDVRKKI